MCEQLVPVSQLGKLKAIKNLFHVLHTPGVTRVERSTAAQSVREFSGPILDSIGMPGLLMMVQSEGRDSLRAPHVPCVLA